MDPAKTIQYLQQYSKAKEHIKQLLGIFP